MNEIIEKRFNCCLEFEQIMAQVTVRPEPVTDLSAIDSRMAGELLAQALKQIFIPNEFTIAFIHEMVGRAALHSRLLFPSEVQYASRIYDPPDTEVIPVCLTGLAGVGKSQTITALRKVLPAPVDFTCNHYHGSVSLVSHWYASARGKASGKGLLADFITGGKVPTHINVAELLIQCRRRANRDGVSLVLLEETQHINTGLGAAKVTDILLTMAAIGPPMIFVSNYSLVHKLLRRNSEDKQRLLSDPRIMLPDEPGSSDWKAYIDECVRVSNGSICVGRDDLAAEIYRCTFGIKRLAVQLLKQAYIECRNSGRRVVGLADITCAYRSAAYTTSANEVEELKALALSNRKSRTHLDLQCPFELPATVKSNVVQFARTERQNRVSAKMFDSALTEGERAAKKQLEASMKGESLPAKPSRRPPVIKATEEEQAKAFFDYIDAGKGSPKPE
ncbi:transposase [Pseudomonas laurylsulfatiphila]|uniref:transposase n=1 Tax=Pseudomonas laurylsulfatiphila TaxID=2011015 RepID=UPI00215EA512|nr:transposase [Pseudomonas laurylsulfatiphila]UVM05097.1 transposase [Pseudomonas laurylsulfatiphila]